MHLSTLPRIEVFKSVPSRRRRRGHGRPPIGMEAEVHLVATRCEARGRGSRAWLSLIIAGIHPLQS